MIKRHKNLGNNLDGIKLQLKKTIYLDSTKPEKGDYISAGSEAECFFVNKNSQEFGGAYAVVFENYWVEFYNEQELLDSFNVIS